MLKYSSYTFVQPYLYLGQMYVLLLCSNKRDYYNTISSMNMNPAQRDNNYYYFLHTF